MGDKVQLGLSLSRITMATCCCLFSLQAYLNMLPAALHSSSLAERAVLLGLDGGVALLIGLILRKRPRWLSPTIWSAISIVLTSFSVLALLTDNGDAALLVVGLNVVVQFVSYGISTEDAPNRSRLCAIALGCIAACALSFIANAFHLPGKLMLAIATIATPCVTLRATRNYLRKLPDLGPTDLAMLMNPHSFLPFSNKFFIAIVAYAVMNGFAIQIISMDLSKTFTVSAAVVPVLCLTFAFCLHAKEGSYIDTLYAAMFLFAEGGLLLAVVYLQSEPLILLMQLFFQTSTVLFFAFLIFALSCLSLKNPVLGGQLFAFALMAFCWGIGLDTFVWLLGTAAASDVLPPNMPLLIFLFIFFAFSSLGLRNFSFDETLTNLPPMKDISKLNLQSLSDRCNVISKAALLTKRESEVFELLASGRNGPAIEKKLFISHNTIKTHIRNIYSKLGVHSHQELIDLVENYPE